MYNGHWTETERVMILAIDNMIGRIQLLSLVLSWLVKAA